MELRRVVTSLASRWWILAIVGLVGAIVAAVFVQQRNNDLQPMWRAEATVAIPIATVEEGRSSGELPDELSTALELAQIQNEDEVRKDTRFIEADGSTDSLLFVAIDRTESAAAEAAEEMRDTYVAADPNFDSDAELKALLKKASVIEKRLDEITPVEDAPVQMTSEETAAADAQRAALESKTAAITAKMGEINTLILDSDSSSDINDYEEQLDDYEAQLEELNLEIAALPTPEPEVPVEPVDPQATPPGLSITDAWTYEALQAELTELQTQSASLIVSSVTGENLDLGAAEVTDETPAPIPSWLSLVVGFLAGVLLGSAVLLVRDRVKGVVWHQNDVSNLTVLAEPPSNTMDDPDVTDIDRQRRKRSVQAIRSAIIGAGNPDSGSVVGFAAPPSTDSHVLEDLAYDVATSLSAVGRSVLVVDLGFVEKSGLARHAEGVAVLRDLFESVADDEVTIRRRAQAVIGAAEKQSQGLDVLVADPDIIEPADILAGRPVGELLEQGRNQYDFVIVVQPTTGVSSGAVIDTHLQQQIIVCTRGRTTISEIASEAIPSSGIHVKVVGVVLLAPPSRRLGILSRFSLPESRPSRQRTVAAVPEPMPVERPPEIAPTPVVVEEVEAPQPAKAASKPARSTKTAAASKPATASKAASPKQTESKPAARRRPAEKQPAPKRRRTTRSRQENSEEAAERLRALETYSVDESLYIKTPEPPADSA